MLDAMKNLQSGNIDMVNNSMLWPLMRWSSSNKSTLHEIQELNYYFFWVPQDLTKVILSDIRKRQPPFMRFPKPVKFDDKKYNILAAILKEKYHWSKRELAEQKGLIIYLLNDTEYLTRLANDYGLPDKEKRVLGLRPTKVKRPVIPKGPQTKSLFNF